MRRQNNKLKNVLFLFILIIIVAAGVFVYFSPQFEKSKPQISFNNSNYWNLKDKLSLSLYDESGIGSYKVTYKSANSDVEILSKTISSKEKTVAFEIEPFAVNPEIKEIKILVEAYDKSMWNFFMGNVNTKEYVLTVDKKAPQARVIVNSRTIKRGGAGTVVVKVSDENLKDKYITFNNNHRFELIPYIKENYYVAVFAWPIDIEFDDFDIVNLVAIDKANNKTVKKVPVYIKDLKIKSDKLKISENFINKVSIPVLEKSNMSIPSSNADIFIAQNRDLRAKNIATIKNASIDNMSKDKINKFSINAFKRLERSKTFAGFAERREYSYEGEKIDEAWHLGMDWASIRRAPIKVSNQGKVIFNDYLGIYGNTLIIDHGLGIQSLYAHTSKFSVQTGDRVNKNQQIANTGSTGAVFGDHLHFGMLVQGVEVNPLEWMDRNWIKSRVLNILAEARQEIRSSK